MLASILLSQRCGVPSTVCERAAERSSASDWTAKSYTIVLNERGKGALARSAECLAAASEAGQMRRFLYFFDGKTGDVPSQPKDPPGLGFTRPLLVSTLERVAAARPDVTLRRGARVTGVVATRGGEGGRAPLQVQLDDGASMEADFVIGADGKWSSVRQSIASFQGQVPSQPQQQHIDPPPLRASLLTGPPLTPNRLFSPSPLRAMQAARLWRSQPGAFT